MENDCGNEARRDPADEAVAAALQVIEEAIRTGSVPTGSSRPADEENLKRLDAILAEIFATQQFALAIGNGDLSRDLAVRGYLAGSLKSLQANLRHLTWQAEQIASGDLTQRVHFLGDFSASFNAMVEHLAEDEIDRTRREEELKNANTALGLEIEGHRRSEGALTLTNRKLSLLASITRHDIRNQLMAIDAYLEMSRHAIGDPAATAGFLEKEIKIVKTIVSQIEFTRDYENLGIKEPVWNHLGRIIEGVRSDLPFGPVRLVEETGGVEIYADLLFSRVFYNLIDNALRYGGEMMTMIGVSAEEGPDGLVITVHDDGAGIATADREHLFTKGFGKNTGFGLHLSREILSLTGISILEDSGPGMGARFRIKVPKTAYRFR